jgi:hypothetical protein
VRLCEPIVLLPRCSAPQLRQDSQRVLPLDGTQLMDWTPARAALFVVSRSLSRRRVQLHSRNKRGRGKECKTKRSRIIDDVNPVDADSPLLHGPCRS